MASRQYRERERELQKIRPRSRSPGVSDPLTEARYNARVERHHGWNSPRLARDDSSENLNDLHSTRTKSPGHSSDLLQGGRHRSRPQTRLCYLTKDERRKIGTFRERWGRQPRYPDCDPAESSANEEELVTRKHIQEMLEKHKAFDEKRAAEEERRRNIGPEARAVEDGDKLLREIEADDNILVVLERSSSNRARCRAVECIYAEKDGANAQYIADEFRICINKGRAYDGKHYYHGICFERMIALGKLFPSKFLMSGGPWDWGLMVRRWFENRGCINPDKIAAYIEAKERYNEAESEFSSKWIKWSLNHQKKCEDEKRMCECAPKPTGPEEPVLQGYKTSKEDKCCLWEVLAHPRCDDMCEPIVVGGPIPPFWLPKEEVEHDPKAT